MSTWGENLSPWNELDWGNKVVAIDEPILPYWGWPGDLNNADDVCGEIGTKRVRKMIDETRMLNPGAKIWLNYSVEEFVAVVRFCNEPPGLHADIFSIDSYGGIWDWEIHMRWRLDQILRLLEPGQQMGLIPEGHTLGDAINWSPIDYVMIGTLYFDWAMRHDDTGKIYALAPFVWTDYPDMPGISSKPYLVELYSNLAVEYPRCPTE